MGRGTCCCPLPRGKLGASKAITATAHKLARIIYDDSAAFVLHRLASDLDCRYCPSGLSGFRNYLRNNRPASGVGLSGFHCRTWMRCSFIK